MKLTTFGNKRRIIFKIKENENCKFKHKLTA